MIADKVFVVLFFGGDLFEEEMGSFDFRTALSCSHALINFIIIDANCYIVA